MDYYNEIDPGCAEWIRNLIAVGAIGAGEVDERSIEDVKPSDLKGYTQCHFFAGIGVWSYALRQAGWPAGRQVWTGSCPCQPFSAAGKGGGFTDERHLWPAFYHLISQRRPTAILGEQVASKDAGPWIDLVHTDLEALGYPFGAVPFPSAGVGAPHIRDRCYWAAGVAQGDASTARLQKRFGLARVLGGADGAGQGQAAERAGVYAGFVGLADGERVWQQRGEGDSAQTSPGHREHGNAVVSAGDVGRGADTDNGGRIGRRPSQAGDGRDAPRLQPERLRDAGDVPRPTNGFWRAADWLGCRDGKFRPVEPGTFPLVDGFTGRVGLLRGYGNAINAEAAKVFIEAYLDT